MTHPEPPHRAAYDRLWQVPITFNSHWNAIKVDPAWLMLKIEGGNRYVFGVLAEKADALPRIWKRRKRSAAGSSVRSCPCCTRAK